MEELPKQVMPSVIEMAFNLTGTAYDVLKGAVERGIVMAPDDVVKDRWETCWNCEHLKKEPEGGIIPCRCSLCGCAMKVKSRFLMSRCPGSKWKR